RSILTYLVAIICLVFYLSLGPLYICFALFKNTQRIFEGWLSQLAAYMLQPVIIFAYLMMIESYIPNFISMLPLDSITNQVQPNATEQMIQSPMVFNGLFGQWCQHPGADGKCNAFQSGDWDFMNGFGDWASLFGSTLILALLNYATIVFLDAV